MLIRKDVIKLTFPIVIEQIFLMSLGMVNTILASRIGEEAAAAIGIVDSINFIFIAFFSALAVGGTVVVAHYIGQCRVDEANNSAQQAIFSGIIISVILTILLFAFRHFIIITMFGSAEKEVLQNAYIYFNITVITYPFICMSTIATGVLRGAGDTKTPMNINIFINIINLVLSYILIYGLSIKVIHIPGFGVLGAAVAISIARVVGTIIITIVLLRGTKLIKLSNIKGFKIDFPELKSIFRIGIPASIESLMFNGGKLITQVFIVGMGTVSMAANYIANSITSFVMLFGTALTIAATTLVGQAMGKGDSKNAESTMDYIYKLSSVLIAFVSLILYWFIRPIVSLYTINPDIIDLTAYIISHYCFVAPVLWSISFVLPSGLKGAGDVKYTMITAIISMWIFRIVSGYVFAIPLKLGVQGIWYGMYADWAVRGILYYIRLKRGKWKNNVVLKPQDKAIVT